MVDGDPKQPWKFFASRFLLSMAVLIAQGEPDRTVISQAK